MSVQAVELSPARLAALLVSQSWPLGQARLPEGEPAKPGEPRRGAPPKAQAGAVGDGAEGRRPGG